ncbi:hypothetical protein JCM31826_07760 [Thermaurantimonas aggregans]|uniref:PD-(D/E)XK endonuclease-like domain-containing protein n=1 Tax=Thermaurantimonas aggregans TaxID=2173829 RepID=A0A401XJY1_9FLAO|nr:PD-(D/E)XK nuclease family protein [Thermaurantimonas aggregans]GCD77294.1 hypothetical protein JCM31826_07760 [Thermaurantimonas aggregans]
MSFLHSVANQIFEEHKDNLHDITVVLPSQRSCIFFLRYLADRSESVVIAPDVLTMDQFIASIAHQEPTEYSKLLLAFIEVARKHIPERCSTLGEFMSWGPIVLNDFNSLDEQLIEPISILTNTARAKILEQWQLHNDREKGELEKKFEKFYESLPKLYDEFISQLKKKKYSTRGLLYRKAAESINTLELTSKKVYFIGFNALTKAEFEVINALVTSGKGEFIGHYDTYYCIHFPNHEAGTFYRKWKEKNLLSPKSQFTDDLLTQQKRITHHRVSGRVQQTKIVAQVIEQLKEQGYGDFKRVAVVLPDENMLFPVLHHLPVVPEGINVTMQLPLEQLPVYQWILSFIKSVEYASRDESKGKFYHRQLKEVLSNALAYSFFEPERIKKLLQDIIDNNLIFVDHKKVNETLCDGDQLLFSPAETPQQLIDAAKALLEIGIAKSPERDMLEREQLFMMREVLAELKDVTAAWPQDFLKLQDLVLFLEAIARSYGISLRGEPVQGLQIMGMLETRLLDFDTIIILSANDGILPKSAFHQSIIPYDIAVAHGLPEHRHQLAIYSYHFYQLIRNAKEIHLISYAPAIGNEQAIPSRFIYQIEWELAAENRKIEFNYIAHILTPKIGNYSSEFHLKKDEAFVRDLSDRLKSKGISPTHLANYIERPRDFYTKYMLGIQDVEEDVAEQADARIKGVAVHNTLKRLYEPFLNSTFPNVEALKVLEAQVDQILDEELHRELPNADWNTGRNFLEKFLIKQMILNQLQIDRNRLTDQTLDTNNLSIAHLEKSFETTLLVPHLGEIKLYGTLDRLERAGNHFHNIDYKTGSAPSNKHFDLENIDFFDKKKRINAGKPLQLLCYLLMVADSLGKNESSYSAALHFIKYKKEQEKFLFKTKTNNWYSFDNFDNFTFKAEDLETYRNIVIRLIEEMLDIHTIENQYLSEIKELNN